MSFYRSSIIKLLYFVVVLFSLSKKAHAEDTLYVLTPYFTVKMPGFYEGEEGITPSGCDSFYSDISDIMDDTQLNYLLWDYLGPYGEVFNNDIHISSNNADCDIVRIEQQYTTDILFNEDGCGGVWSIGGLDNPTSDWVPIKIVDDGHYITLSETELATTKPVLSEETVDRAEEHIASRQIPTTYDEYVTSVGIRIIWAVRSDTFETLLNFDFEYGD